MDAAKAVEAHHLLQSSNTPGLEQAGAGTLQEPGGFPWCAVPTRVITGAAIPPPATAHVQHSHTTWLAKCSRAMLPTKPSIPPGDQILSHRHVAPCSLPCLCTNRTHPLACAQHIRDDLCQLEQPKESISSNKSATITN